MNDYINENIEYSLKYLKLLSIELKFYDTELNNIESHKPFSFQKNRKRKYEQEKAEIKKNIEICNNKIKKQYELIAKIVDNKDN